MSAMTLDEINALDEDAFVAVLGPVFENSPWVARGAWGSRPFAGVPELHRAMFAVVEAADRQTVLDFLNAHPALAGKEAQAGEMTTESVGEQASAGLDALSPEEFARIGELNRTYQDRHGFPFVIAVRGHTKASILAEFERRIGADTEAELRAALDQIALISRGRLDRAVAG
ncbi:MULTISPECIES: 2-oxo-4-hydroxy-4-carboxy-5-ureidoimidazoline decarboxylase [unclassified Microbacterium]|uniref:2-oxo-4-hydroxy-4-carboxy-5-ureidoimidazoline decarboxylase n=1 Tax=unclassified Microbacterium TaxID=2609290 RepID=UPI00365F58EF